MPPIAGAVGTRELFYGNLVRSVLGGSLNGPSNGVRSFHNVGIAHWNKRAEEETPDSGAPPATDPSPTTSETVSSTASASRTETDSTSSFSSSSSSPTTSTTTSPTTSPPKSSTSRVRTPAKPTSTPRSTPTSTPQTGGQTPADVPSGDGSNDVVTPGGKNTNNAASPSKDNGVAAPTPPQNGNEASPTPSALGDHAEVTTPVVTKTQVTLTSLSASTTTSGSVKIVTTVPVVFTSEVSTTLQPESTGTSLATTSSSSPHTKAMIGGGVAGGLILFALLLVCFVVIRRRRSKLPHFEEVYNVPGGTREYKSLDQRSYTITPVSSHPSTGSTNLVVPKVSVTDFPSPPSMKPTVPRIITHFPPSLVRIGNDNLVPPQKMQSAITPASIFQVGGMPPEYGYTSPSSANFRDSVPSEPDMDAYQSSPGTTSHHGSSIKSSDPFRDHAYSAQ